MVNFIYCVIWVQVGYIGIFYRVVDVYFEWNLFIGVKEVVFGDVGIQDYIWVLGEINRCW